MPLVHSLVRNFAPPILFKRRRVGDRLAQLLLRALSNQSLPSLQTYYLKREVDRTPEIRTLFPDSDMREHWGYARLENTSRSPNLYIHQLRFYRLVQFFRRSYPDVFDPHTRLLDIGDTSGVLFRAIGQPGLSLNLRPDRVAYIRSRGVEAVVGNAESLDFEDDSFDYVFCFQTLEHMLSPVRALQEMGRVARRAVFISIPFVDVTRIWGRTGFIRDYRGASPDEAASIQDDECHFFEFSAADLIKLLTFTPLTCDTHFTLDYFAANERRSLIERPVIRLTPSHFNFFVLHKSVNVHVV